MNPPDRGSIKDRSVIEILKDAARTSLTGMIRLENGPVIKVAYLQKGAISFASSNDKTDRLTEVLKRAGKLTPEQVEDAQARIKQNVSIGKTLVELGYISAKELLWGARALVNGILHHLLFWTDGKYQIIEGSLPREIIHLNLSIPSVIFEGIMNTQNREWILQHIGSPDAIYGLTTDFEKQNETLKLPVQDVVSHLNGRRSLHDIAEKSELDSFEICKTVVALERLDLATAIQDVPLQMDLSTPEVEPDVPQILEEIEPASAEEAKELEQVMEIRTVAQLETPSAPEPQPVLEQAAALPAEDKAEAPALTAEPQQEEPQPPEPQQEEPQPAVETPAVPHQEPSPRLQEMFQTGSDRQEPVKSKSWKGLVTILLVAMALALGFFYYRQHQPNESVIPVPKPRGPEPIEINQPATIVTEPAPDSPEDFSTDPTEESPASPPLAGPSNISNAPPLDLLKSGKIAEAAAAWSKQVGSARNLYSIQLVIACQDKTVTDTHRLINYSEGIIVLPLSYKGQNCYRVLFGKFSSREAATSAVKMLPEEFLKQSSPATVVDLSRVR